MARKVQILLEDDLDGSIADETIHFALDGTTYEIDLSKANALRLREALAPYVAAGRKAATRRTREASSGAGDRARTRAAGARKATAKKSGAAKASAAKASGRKTRRPTGARAAGVDPAAVRAWAQSHGVKVNPRGRIAMETINAFRAAGN